MRSFGKPPVCWVVTDGNAGMENQCLGLAEALGLAPVIKRIRLRAPWDWLPPRLGALANPLLGIDPRGDVLMPPWPDIVIATGRRTVAISVAIRRASRKTITVQIQNPHFPADAFDLVVTPAHDGLTGRNVITTAGALHRVTRARLDAAANEFRATLAHLPQPLIAVLIGGANKVYRLNPQIVAELCSELRDFAAATGCGLAVTPSRRTGAENIAQLRQGLVGTAHIIWNGEGANPYFGYLGLADGVIVTADSINMVSEACATGKPVYVYDLPGGSAKFDAFHQAMRARGAVRPFVLGQTRELELWTQPEINDTAMVAKAVQPLLYNRNN